MAVTLPKFVSEREPGPDYHCVWCSGLMLANAVSGGKYPATLAEAKALRGVSGDGMTGGSSIADLNKGMLARYGWVGTSIFSESQVLEALTPGRCMAIIGRPANCGERSPFRRFLSTFPDLHCVFLANTGSGYWLMDPEGPGDGSYNGQYVTLTDIRAYYEGDGAVVDTIGRLAPGEDVIEVTDVNPYWINVAQGKPAYTPDGKPFLTIPKALVDHLSPYGTTVAGVKYRVLRLSKDYKFYVALVRDTDVSRKVAALDPAGVAAKEAAARTAAKVAAVKAVEAI